MSIRQLDTWVLDVYLDEAGWDGQHDQVHFTTKRDAEAVGKAVEARVNALDDDHRLEWSVYKLTPYASFHNRPKDLAEVARKIGDGWLEDIEYEIRGK
jgi:hypothetical protein